MNPGLGRFALAGGAALWSLLGGLACAPSPGEPALPNILLISIDTLRADHLGCYGYARDTSPNLDRLAGRSVVYENVLAPAPWTLPSHAGILTGRHPKEIGIADRNSAIPADVPLLAEVLRDAGYETAAFVDSAKNGFVGGRRGFARGFETYLHSPHPGAALRNDMAATVTAGLGWLEKRSGARPSFLFLHTKSVHSTPEKGMPVYHKLPPFEDRFLPTTAGKSTWTAPGELTGSQVLALLNRTLGAFPGNKKQFTPAKLQALIALYDAGIAYVDEQIQRLLDGLGQLDLDQNTVVIVLSDHGEAFLDHRFFGHNEVYDSVLRVPLIVHDPRESGGHRVPGLVLLTDVFGMVLDRAGLQRPFRGSAGLSRVRPAGDALQDQAVSYHYYYFDENRPYEAYALRTDTWKLVWHHATDQVGFSEELYKIDVDPLEQQPVAGEDARRQEMQARLLEWIEQEAHSGADPIQLDPSDLEELRALGYGN